VNQHPVERVEASGLRLQGKELIELDVIILATGFDSVTGSLGQLNIQGINASGTIGEHWKDGLRTALGIGMSDFPNLLFLYGPQAPTAFSNGPSCTQFQAEFVEEFLRRAVADGITRVEPKKSVEEDWHRRMHEEWDKTLFPLAKSWYQGSNIPGRRVEPLNFAGGLDKYTAALYDSLEDGYQGWHVEKGGKQVEA
jgi:cation diffusion facilitator CzcD-associated flavoprotein CzcO